MCKSKIVICFIKGDENMKDFVELSKKWFDKQASVYDETDTLLYSKYGKISCQNIKNILN